MEQCCLAKDCTAKRLKESFIISFFLKTMLEYLWKRDRRSHVGAGINQKQKSCPVFWALYRKAPRNWAAFYALWYK